MAAHDQWQVRRLAGSLGAEIVGPDLNQIAAGDQDGIDAVMKQLRVDVELVSRARGAGALLGPS